MHNACILYIKLLFSFHCIQSGLFQNRKIDICVINIIIIMADTTISVSKRFHDWLKDKGSKGESYEDIIKKVIKADFPRESSSKDAVRSPVADSQKPKAAPKDIKKAADDSS